MHLQYLSIVHPRSYWFGNGGFGSGTGIEILDYKKDGIVSNVSIFILYHEARLII
jgi:hypothetical protein